MPSVVCRSETTAPMRASLICFEDIEERGGTYAARLRFWRVLEIRLLHETIVLRLDTPRRTSHPRLVTSGPQKLGKHTILQTSLLHLVHHRGFGHNPAHIAVAVAVLQKQRRGKRHVLFSIKNAARELELHIVHIPRWASSCAFLRAISKTHSAHCCICCCFGNMEEEEETCMRVDGSFFWTDLVLHVCLSKSRPVLLHRIA
jgi:hypothetical protein